MSAGRDIFVLSGGGSRGAAQIGMLRGLIGAGVIPDVLIGASVGAINACAVGIDPTPQRVENLADRWMTMDRYALTGRNHAVLVNLAKRRPYLFSSARLRALVSEWLDVDNLEDMAVDVRIATTDLATGAPHHHTHGNVINLIAASAALPAVFPPVLIDTGNGPTPHVDAGLAENLPMSGAVAIAVPGDRIWALDVTKRSSVRNLRNPLDVLIASIAATVSRKRDVVIPVGVEVIECKLDEAFHCGPVFDFTHTGTLFRMGEETVTRSLLARASFA